MYKYIEENEQFRDIKSDYAKNNYMRIMNGLDNITLPNVKNEPYYPFITKTLNEEKFDDYVEYLCGKIFLDENNNRLARELANNRIEKKFNGYPFGYTSNNTNLKHIIRMEGCKYFTSPTIAIHEITHAISLINNATIPKEYVEVLSIFNELRATHEMGEIIQDACLFNKIIHQLKYRIYLKDLSDESINNLKPNEGLYFDLFFRTLNLVYALRLYELYTMFPEEISKDVDDILKKEGNILELLEKYQISLENEDTIKAFEKIIVEFERIVNKYFNKDKRK